MHQNEFLVEQKHAQDRDKELKKTEERQRNAATK